MNNVTPVLSNRTYNFIKWLATVFLPAVGALYFGLAQTFDFSRISGVNGTINAVIMFLGLLMAGSTKQYNKTANSPDGDLIISVDPVDGEKYLGLGVERSIEAMQAKGQVRLNVVDKTATDPRMQAPRAE